MVHEKVPNPAGTGPMPAGASAANASAAVSPAAAAPTGQGVVFSLKEKARVRVGVRGSLPYYCRRSLVEARAFVALLAVERGRRVFLVAEKERLERVVDGEGRVAVSGWLPEGAVVQFYYETVRLNKAFVSGAFFRVAWGCKGRVALRDERSGEAFELEVENLEPLERLTSEEYAEIDAAIRREFEPSKYDPVHLLWKAWMR
ncbi:MAG: hypothetical protein QXT28_09040 [Thermofilaceae archaeon]